MLQLPTTFWAQLFARFGEKSPKFHQILMKGSAVLVVVSLVMAYVVDSIVPGMGSTAPVWLVFINAELGKLVSFLVGLGLGGITIGATTVATKDTPPLLTGSTDTDKDAIITELAREMGEMKQKIAQWENPPTNGPKSAL